MTATAKKVYDGLSEHVTPEQDRERIRRTLYRTDAEAMGTVLPSWRAQFTDTDLEQYRTQGYVAMEGLLTPAEVPIFPIGIVRRAEPASPCRAPSVRAFSLPPSVGTMLLQILRSRPG